MQNAPSDTETIGVTFNRGSWNLGLFSKRVGEMWQDNGATHQAVAIDPFNITNVFVNYQLRGLSPLQNTRIRFAVNNLTDSHAITGVTPASVNSNSPGGGRHPDAHVGPKRVGVADPRFLTTIGSR